MKRPLRESDIEKYLVKQTKAAGGECRKVKWLGRDGAPDRLVMLPGRADEYGPAPGYQIALSGRRARTIWIELKAPGKKAEPHQLREHARMRKMGQRVVVIDSLAGVDEVLA